MKKLIETALPVEAISRAAALEKRTHDGRPAALHMWWTQRTLTSARAVLFASLIDDPSERADLFLDEKDQDAERKRLLSLIEDMVQYGNHNSSEQILEECRKYGIVELPKIYDPFSGSGAIPFEAQKIGCVAEAQDYNPVAVLISKGVLQYPSHFFGMKPVHSESGQQSFTWSVGQGLAADVRYYGNKVAEAVERKLSVNYPLIETSSKEKKDVFAWIWARTIKCPNPGCGCDMPLLSDYILSNRSGAEAYAEPKVEDGNIRFEVREGIAPKDSKKSKVAHTAVFKCPKCGATTTDEYVKEYSQQHHFGSTLVAEVIDVGGIRRYVDPTDEQIAAAEVELPTDIPHGEIPAKSSNFSPAAFGYRDFSELYTNRQLLFLTTLAQTVTDMKFTVEEDAKESGMAVNEAYEYSLAVITYLGIAVSKLTERCSTLTSWNTSIGGKLRSVFSRAVVPMRWDYVETNPFYSSSGSLKKTIEDIATAVEAFSVKAHGMADMHSALDENEVRNAVISTEVPYYDRADYGGLSDYFYIWLRYTLKDLYPDLLKEELTPKEDEVSALPYMWGGDKQLAKAICNQRIHKAMANLYPSISAEFPNTFSFYYKRTLGEANEWENFIDALINAGFRITAAWPIGRKVEDNIDKAMSKGVPITIVARRKSDTPGTTRRRFVVTLKRELPKEINRLVEQGVSAFDLRPCAAGIGWRIYTDYETILDADGNKMSTLDASRLIEEEIDEYLSLIMTKNTKESED